jgi:hypothetical protein
MLDWEKAFDSVNHKAIDSILNKIQLHVHWTVRIVGKRMKT